MNIAIISYFFNDHHAEGIVTAKLARALAEAGHSVSIFGNLIGNQNIIDANINRIHCYKIKSHTPKWWDFLEKFSPANTIGKKILSVPRLITYSSPSDFGWIINVKKSFIKAHQEQPFDLIHSRLNPHSSHQAALFIKKSYPNIPWCAYFSDPWPPHRLPAPYQSSIGALSKWRADNLMESFLEISGSNIFTTTYIRDYLLTHKRLEYINKSFVAPHLSTYWETSKSYIKKDRLRFRHAGIINQHRNPNILFDGVRQFLKKNKNAANIIRFEFIGRNNAGPDSDPLKVPEDLKTIIHFYDQETLKKTWEWLVQADILLLLEFHFSKGIFFYAKLADYLHARRPILALSPEKGVVADLFKEGGGKIAAPNNSEQIANTIGEIFTLWESENLEKITPNKFQAEKTYPDKIIPIYEKAFKTAIKNN